MAAHSREALVVEDDRGHSELAALLLGEFDLSVTQVSTAQVALDHLMAHAERVSVVLIGVHLDGGMDGIALAKRISILWPALSILVTSGDRGLPHGALPSRATFIPKPWLPLDIVSAADRAARADHSIRAVTV